MATTSVCSILVLCLFFTALHLTFAGDPSNNCNGQTLVKNVTKEIIWGGYRARLYLEGCDFPTVVVYAVKDRIAPEVFVAPQYMKPIQVVPVETTADGVVEFTYSPHEDYNQVVVNFHHAHGAHYAILKLKHNTISEQNIPQISFTIQGRSTLSEGNDISLNVSFLINDNQNDTLWSDVIVPTMYSRSDSESDAVLAQTVELEFEKNTVSEKQAQIHLSQASEGVLSVKAMAAFQCEQGCLLSSYVIDEQVPFRHNDSTGPFPHAFVGFPKHPYSSGVYTAYCFSYDGSTCQVRCEVFGYHPSVEQLVRRDSASNATLPTLVSSSVSDYWAEGWFQIDNMKPEDAGDYVCQVRSDGLTKEINITLIIY